VAGRQAFSAGGATSAEKPQLEKPGQPLAALLKAKIKTRQVEAAGLRTLPNGVSAGPKACAPVGQRRRRAEQVGGPKSHFGAVWSYARSFPGWFRPREPAA